jgi:hypothetical protein
VVEPERTFALNHWRDRGSSALNHWRSRAESLARSRVSALNHWRSRAESLARIPSFLLLNTDFSEGPVVTYIYL